MTWTQNEFCTWPNPLRGQEPPKMYIVYQPRRRPSIVQSLVDVRFSDVKPRRETRWNLLGCPKLVNRSQPLMGWSSTYYENMWKRYCCLTSFPHCRYLP